MTITRTSDHENIFPETRLINQRRGESNFCLGKSFTGLPL